MTREDIKTITDIVHKTIYGFFDVCGDDEETPMTDKDKLLLKVNKALCNNIKALEQEPCEDAISRQAVIKAIYDNTDRLNIAQAIRELPSVNPQEPNSDIRLNRVNNELNRDKNEQEPKTGHWSRKTKVDAYDIAGVKTWGIKCQCDRCDFTTIVVEDFGYYKYCPNCGAKMVETQESEG